MSKKSQIKLPTARRLPSGNWTVQLRLDGESISITRPTEKEAIAEAMAIKQGVIKARKIPLGDRTLTQAIDLWIQNNENRLSPATVRGYVTCQKNGFQQLMDMRCRDITKRAVESAINAECKNFSAKTVTNRWRFLSQVLEWATGERIEASLPQVVRKDHEILDPDDIKVYLRHIKGKKVEIPALLAISSLRRSEMVALNWDNGDIDFKHRLIHVRGAVVPDKNNKLVRKETNKNTASRRDVDMIEPLYQALMAVENKTGPVVRAHPATILSWINASCQEAGLPEVGCHGLRHSFASLCHELKLSPQKAMEMGGWADRGTMDRIYTHVSQRMKDKASNAFLDYFKALPDESSTENANKTANAD